MRSLTRFLSALLIVPPVWSQVPDSGDLTSASLEDLLQITVTSVAKKEQSVSRDDTANSFAIAFTPASVDDSLFAGFIQDEIELKPDRLYLKVGAKLERNDYTGVTVSPSEDLRVPVERKRGGYAKITWSF